MDELRGVEVRLERAREHIDALHHESMMFLMELPPPYGYIIPDEAIDGEYIVRAKVFRPPPLRLGVLAADGAHTLRAALDMLAWSRATKGQKRRFVAVLHQGPVDSPTKAMRAAIVQENRQS